MKKNNKKKISYNYNNKLLAKKIPHQFSIHNENIIDNYYWMRDEKWPQKVDNPDIIEHIIEENNNAKKILSKLNRITNEIYTEILERIPIEYKSCPIIHNDYAYYSISWRDKNYSRYVRYPIENPDTEEVLLDLNDMSEGYEYFSVPGYEISYNNNLLAYFLDVTGEEKFTIYIKDIKTNTIVDSTVDSAFYGIIWDKANEGFFYIEAAEDWRQKKIFYHKIGSSIEDDIMLYEEKDNTYSVDIYETDNDDYIVLHIQSADCTEIRILDKLPESDTYNWLKSSNWYKILDRNKGYRCSISQDDEYFYLTIDDLGKNFRLISIPIESVFPKELSSKILEEDFNYTKICYEEISHHNEKYLSDILVFKNYIVIMYQTNGLKELSIYKKVYKKDQIDSEIKDIQINNLKKRELLRKIIFIDNITMSDPCYDLDIMDTPYDSDVLRYIYSSLRCPSRIYEYNFISKEINIIEEYPMPENFQEDNYVIQRIWADSRDGFSKIPISLIFHKYKVKNYNINQFYKNKEDIKSLPLLLYGYGSYGIGIDCSFRNSIISLLDRGFIYAIGHIRGGDDLGLEWYEQAKMLNKKRTFNDFIDVSETLINLGYTKPGDIVIHGGSAGGMLVGVCVNEKPELYRAVIAEVPFVDVLNTMLDSSLPLTPGEYKEWGNPEENKEYFEYIQSYSPYDNVKNNKYPHMFVTAGINDPRVGYWEAMKWVAKLREFNNNTSSIILLKTDMGTGHSGKSGRIDAYKDIAEKYAFIIKNCL
ncbi:S9 family peptidase [Lyticum sinuosum]|nr:prolyl oligopeptidase family serine peptidase [Lyticum sinuosum]